MITTVLFDLDGTLLPMDQDEFVKAYMAGLAKKMIPYGYDPERLVKSIWKGTGAMVQNDGSTTNEELFWNVFSSVYGSDVRKDEPIFQNFYENEFQTVQSVCGFDPRSAALIRTLKEKGLRVVLATNPLFPSIATYSRTRWAGLEPSDFELITTYENSRHCKPNPEYYRDILDALNLTPEECIMVGNDATEDIAAEKLGIPVFLLTDCLINKDRIHLDRYPHGSFSELRNYIQRLAL